MNDDTEQPNSDAQKAKAAGSVDAKHNEHKKKEGKHEKPADKKIDKEHGHHA